MHAGDGADIDSVEAIHTGAYADKIIYSNVKSPEAHKSSINNVIGGVDGSYTYLSKNKFAEIQFIDNEVNNNVGPDLAIYASPKDDSGSYKVFVKQSISDSEYISVKDGVFKRGINNIDLPDNVTKVEVIKIVGASSSYPSKIDAIEALHADEKNAIVRLSSQHNVYTANSTAKIKGYVTPCDVEGSTLNLHIFRNDADQTSITDIPIDNVRNGQTYEFEFDADVLDGKNEIYAQVTNQPNTETGKIVIFGGFQNALDGLGGGNSLRLSSATFNESVRIKTTAYIQGADLSTNYVSTSPYEEKTVLDGQTNDHVISVEADDVEIYGLTVKNGNYGIKTIGTNGLKILYNNIFNYKQVGIYINGQGLPSTGLSEDYPVVKFNYLDSGVKQVCEKPYEKIGTYLPTISTPIGIKIDYSPMNSVSSNTILNNVIAVKLTQAKIYLCVNQNYIRYSCIGVYYDPVTDENWQIEIQGNEITDTDLGIVFSQSDNIHLNIFENIISNAKVGILGMAGSADIYNNQISDSDVAIFAPLENVSTYDNIYSNNQLDNSAELPDDIKQAINDELLIGLVNEPLSIRDLITGYGLRVGILTGLSAKLESAFIKIADGMNYLQTNKKLAVNSLNTAINNMTAFQKEIKALNENKINLDQRDNLMVLSEIFKKQIIYIRDNI